MDATRETSRSFPTIAPMEESIYAVIRRESDSFYNDSISPVPGYSFNQYDTVKRAHLYRSSKFEDSATYLGRDKLFFNVVNPPCEVAAKMLNVDTKDIRLWPMNPKSQFSTFLLEKELKLWLKTSEFGELLNRIAEEAPVYGSVVLEKTPTGAELVDIRRLRNDQWVEDIGDSRFVHIDAFMSPSELRESGWDETEVETAIRRFGEIKSPDSWSDSAGDLNQQRGTKLIKITKRYGEVPAWMLDDKLKPGTKQGDKAVRSLFIVAGYDREATNENGKPVGDLGVTLFKSAWRKDWPFEDFHYTKQKGRWLGVGVVEMLFDVQVRINELKNQKRLSMELSALHLFQSPDKNVVRNVLTDLQSGDLITSPGGITPIANEERNLGAFESEEASYVGQAEKLSFAYEAVRGETPASSTPLGTTQIVTQQATSVFAFKRENLCLFLRDFFNELVMPQLMKDLTPEHIMRFVGSAQELLALDRAAAEVEANARIKEAVFSKGIVPTQEEVDAFKEQFIDAQRQGGQSRFVKIKDSFYDDAEFEFDFIIDNEQADPQLLANNLRTVITDMAQNAALLDDPVVALLYGKFAQQIGVSPAEMEGAMQQRAKRQQELAAQAEQEAQKAQLAPMGQPNQPQQ